MTDTTKRCRNCGTEKPTNEFPANRQCRDGLSSWCKDCHRIAVRDSLRRRRARERERSAT